MPVVRTEYHRFAIKIRENSVLAFCLKNVHMFQNNIYATRVQQATHVPSNGLFHQPLVLIQKSYLSVFYLHSLLSGYDVCHIAAHKTCLTYNGATQIFSANLQTF